MRFKSLVFALPFAGPTSGKIAKNTTVKDSNGVKYKTNSSGVLTKEDDESVDGGSYRSPEEPEWDNE